MISELGTKRGHYRIAIVEMSETGREIRQLMLTVTATTAIELGTLTAQIDNRKEAYYTIHIDHRAETECHQIQTLN